MNKLQKDKSQIWEHVVQNKDAITQSRHCYQPLTPNDLIKSIKTMIEKKF